MSNELSPNNAFDGQTYDPTLDYDRLSRQHRDVRDYMADGRWRTLRQISEFLGYPEASISARLRDFRKAKYGSHTLLRQRVNGGLYAYQLVLRTEQDEQTG